MTTYLIPESSSEHQIEQHLDQVYRRGVTYLYGSHEDYTRIWFSDTEQVIYKSTPFFGASLLTLNADETSAVRHVQELELQSMEDAKRTYFASDSYGKIRAVSRLSICLHSNAKVEAIEADFGPVWEDALDSGNPPLIVAALEAARSLGRVESVRAVFESRRESLIADPSWSVLAQRVFESWEVDEQPFYFPTRDIDRLLDRAEACIAEGRLEVALETLNTVVDENPYTLHGHVLRARVLDQLGDHWGAWAAMSVARLYTLSVTENPDLSALDAFIELHQAKIEAGAEQVTPIARQIGMSVVNSYTLEGTELISEFFAEHDAEWRSRWLFSLDCTNPKLLELEPDSRMLQLFRGDALFAEGKNEEALAAWMQFPKGQELEPDSFDSFAHSLHSKTSLGSSELTPRFAQLINTFIQQKSWDEAIEFAKVWEKIEPEAIPLWVGRGVAETFSLRSEEAISSYSKAIELHRAEVDQIYFGEHPVATAYFNRACELTKLGRIDDSLFEDLRIAVSLYPNFADQAPADDYLEAIFSDPRFEASIAAGLQPSLSLSLSLSL